MNSADFLVLVPGEPGARRGPPSCADTEPILGASLMQSDLLMNIHSSASRWARAK